MINPLFRPQENQLQGDALVERMQMRMQQRDVKTPAFLAYFKDVMDTKGYPTKTMEEYGFQPTLSGLLEQANPISGAQQATPSTPTNNFFSQVTPPSVPVSQQTPLPTINPKPIASPGLPRQQGPLPLDNVEPLKTVEQNTQSFNRQGQLLMGYDDQFSGINDRLNKIEEGIASLVQNRGQGLNMNTGGLGYFFNPFGGFYG